MWQSWFKSNHTVFLEGYINGNDRMLNLVSSTNDKSILSLHSVPVWEIKRGYLNCGGDVLDNVSFCSAEVKPVMSFVVDNATSMFFILIVKEINGLEF